MEAEAMITYRDWASLRVFYTYSIDAFNPRTKQVLLSSPFTYEETKH